MNNGSQRHFRTLKVFEALKRLWLGKGKKYHRQAEAKPLSELSDEQLNDLRQEMKQSAETMQAYLRKKNKNL